MDNKEIPSQGVIIQNKEGVKQYLKDLKYPIYFLDFEAITNSKQWMFDNGLTLDQQISSFSILKIEKIDDDETKVKHFNNVGEREDYPKMAKSLTDFYRDNGSVVVWGQDLEIRALAKLLKSSPEGLHKKLSKMLANIIDIQQLFYSNSFIELLSSSKSSLDIVAKEYGVYLPGKLADGKKAHYILEAAATSVTDESHLDNISRRVKNYNNSDVINIKRILVEILKELN